MFRGIQVADVIFYNGQVLTVDSDDSIKQAVAIQGRFIQAVGNDSDLLTLAGPDTDVINLRGRTVIPGIVDIHAHMDREGLKGIDPSLEGANSIDEILAIIRSEVNTKSPGEWVVTMPIGDPPNYADMPPGLQEGTFLTRWQLDSVSPNNPVYIRGIWTPWNVPPSVSVANSLALEIAGIDRHTIAPDPSVVISRNDCDEPTGVFVDHNRFPTVEFTLMKVVPRFTHSQRVEALKKSMQVYNGVGTTCIYEGHGVAPEVLRVYKDMWDLGALTVRSHLVLSPSWRSLKEAEREMERWSHSASGSGFGDDMLRIGGYFIRYRGEPYTARARSAELPYTGWAGFAESYNSASQFRKLVYLAATYNLRVHTLAREDLGDVLNVFEDVLKDFTKSDRRWILEHVLHTTSEQLECIKRLGLVIETIPLTELWLRGHYFMDSPQLSDSAVAHRSYIEQNIPFGLGTDNKPYSPFLTYWAAVARQERQTGRVLGPTQCLSRLQALRAFTLGGAYFCFEENRLGSLEPGKMADLAILSDDLNNMPEGDLPGLYSLLTMVGGKIVHRNGEL